MAKTHRLSGRAVLIRDRRLLLIRYNDGAYYNFPGGGAEAGETLAECTKREVLEETGLSVDVGAMLFTLEVEPQRYGLSGDPHISIFFRCTLNDTAAAVQPPKPDHCPDLPGHSAEAEWVNINILDEISFLPYIPDAIKAYASSGVFEPRFLSGHFEKKHKSGGAYGFSS